MKSNNMFDRVRRDVGFLPDLNTEHAYHCNSLLNLAFVIGGKKKGKKENRQSLCIWKRRVQHKFSHWFMKDSCWSSGGTSANTHYLVVFIVGNPQLITLRLLSTHLLWINWQRNLRFIGKSRLILIIKIIDWYCLYFFRWKSSDLIGYTDRTYQSVLKRSHDYDYFSVSWPTSDDWRVIDAWSIVSYRRWVLLYTDRFTSVTF